jgi:NADPH:quinone reductase-like Zn-dependent oxidoreductase
MPRQVRFDHYGGVEVLELTEVDRPAPADGELLLSVKAAGINPFDYKLRLGVMADSLPIEFPSALGTDVAGVVEEIGEGVDRFIVGDEIVGSTGTFGSFADLVVVPLKNALPKPSSVSWEVAGGLWTVATTAAAMVHAGGVKAGDVVLLAGAGGGVGGLAAQLSIDRGAQVIGVSAEDEQEWLHSIGVHPITYGDGVRDRIEATATELGSPVSVVLDGVGHGYVQLGIELGVQPARIDTVVDYAAAQQYGVKREGRGSGTPGDVKEILELLAAGRAQLPIYRTFPLDRVRDAFTELEQGRARGKIVLIP